MRFAAVSSVARTVRYVGIATALAAVVGCARPGAPAQADPAAAESGPEPSVEGEVVVGRWRGQVVERHAQFVRYSFDTPGEPTMVVELTERRPDHGREFGTDALAVQPAPGAEVTPELMRAVTAWLRAEGPGPDELFGAPPQKLSPPPTPASDPHDLIRSVGWGLLAAWLVAALASVVSARRRRQASDPNPSEARMRRKPGVASMVALVLIAALALGLRFVCSAPTPLDDDALADIGMGLACAAGDLCLHGATASFGGFEHATGFPRMLGLLLSFGLGIGGIQVVLMTLWALALAVTFDAGRRLVAGPTSWFAGALAAVGLLGLLLEELARTGDILWNPAAMALPAALSQAALVRAAATGRPWLFVVAGLFAGLAFEVHISGLALWPGLVIVSIATARSESAALAPTLASRIGHRLVWVPAIAGAVGVTMVVSPAPALANTHTLVGHVGWAGCGLAALSTLAVGFALRWWLGPNPQPAWRPSAVALVVPIAILIGALVAAGGFVDAHPLRYLAPVFPAVALASGWLASVALTRIDRPRTRVAVAVVVAGLVLVVTMPAYLTRMTVDRDRWNYTDLDALAGFLAEHGVHHDELHYAVRGALAGRESHGDRGQRLAELVVGGLRTLGGLDPAPPPDRGPGVPPAWLVAKLRNADLTALPEAASTLVSGDSHTIVLVPYQPIADLAAIRWCVRVDGSPEVCAPATPLPVSRQARRVLPRHELVPMPEPAGDTPVQSYYELPLRWPSDADSSRRVTLQIHARASSQAWRFVNVQGDAVVVGRLPATTLDVTLAPGAHATVTLANIEATADARPEAWWPPLIEVPDDPRMQAIFLPPPPRDD